MPFDCKNPAFLNLEDCQVGHPEHIGDGWCDGDIAYNSDVCNYDGGDCCQATCNSVLCGQNGWSCLDPSATENPISLRRRRAQGQGQQVQPAGNVLLPRMGHSNMVGKRRATSNSTIDAINTIVVGSCAPELAVCFDDSECGFLFMVGSVTPSSDPLQELVKCIEDFDIDGEYFHTPLVDDDGFGPCVAEHCRKLYLECQVSLECFLGVEMSTKKLALDACVVKHCVSTSQPTKSPTQRPSVSVDESVAGLFFEIENLSRFKVDFKQITAGNLNTIPVDTVLEGHVVVTASCDPVGDGTAGINGSILIVKRGCNIYETARMAATHGAVALVFAVDDTTSDRWVPRDRTLSLPVLSMSYAVADSVQTMLRRGKQVRGRLSSLQHCDLMHASGLDLSLPSQSVGGEDCCVAGDVVAAHFLFGYDFWNVGAREFPFCREVDIGGRLTLECIEPNAVFNGDESSMVCASLCKRNGVCEDGGLGSSGHTCPWGGDCQDCGPRNVSSSVTASRHDYGRPTLLEYEAAFDFMCESMEGSRCQSSLVSKYDDFHGSNNVYSSIIRALCLDTTCVLSGSPLQYAVPHGSDASTCYAAQVFVAYLLERVFYEDDGEWSHFDGLCANDDLNNGAVFDVSCDAEEDVASGATARSHPRLSLHSFDLARQNLCRKDGSGMDMAMSMLADIRRQAPSSSGAMSVAYNFPVDQACATFDAVGVAENSPPEIALCALLPFVEYMTVEIGATSSTVDDLNSMSCCEASSIAIADLMNQADTDTFSAYACSTVDTDACPILEMVHESLDDAKAALAQSPECLSTTWKLIAELKDSRESDGGSERSEVQISVGDILEHISQAQFEDYISRDNICWLQWSSEQPMNKPKSGCEAADILLVQHLRLYAPTIAPDVYSAYDRPSSDETVARALSHICDHHWDVELDEFVAVSPFEAVFASLSFEAMCDDPCRCTVEVVEAAGCGFHPGFADRESEYDLDRNRPFCYVADPMKCTNAVGSSVAELDGMGWAFCSVLHDTCQMYGDSGPCAPFVSAEAEVFVPAGATLESLQFVGDEYAVGIVEGDTANAAEARLGLVAGRNLLLAWLLEAALVSPTSFQTHGLFVCNSRLRRCGASADQVRLYPRPVCRSDCVAAMNIKGHQDEVFNDLLRRFDESTVCESRWLPKGFHVNAIKNGHDVEQLHGVLGMDALLHTRVVAGNLSNFGQDVYPRFQNSSVCFSNTATTNITKALHAVECPSRFLKNKLATTGGSGKRGSQFCVGTCPSIAYTETQHWTMYCLYAVPGSCVFVVNVIAVACIALKLVPTKSLDPDTNLLVYLASLAGLLGVVPVATVGPDLVCQSGCKSDLCLRTDALCGLNQTSVYVLMAICICMIFKFGKLLSKLKSMVAKKPIFEDRRVQRVVGAMPLLLAGVSFGVEDRDTENDRFHLARNGVKCQFRYATMFDEALLLHTPMLVICVFMTYFIYANMRICLQVLDLLTLAYHRPPPSLIVAINLPALPLTTWVRSCHLSIPRSSFSFPFFFFSLPPPPSSSLFLCFALLSSVNFDFVNSAFESKPTVSNADLPTSSTDQLNYREQPTPAFASYSN
jgi:hypothetical protein